MSDKKRVAIVGGGISGIVAVKSCLEEGLDPMCFEQHDKTGGLWYYTEEYRPNQGARAFDNMRSNVCKDMFAFSDFPFPADCPTFLTCSLVCRYIDSYCDRFCLREHIQLNTKVTKVRKSRDYTVTGQWEVATEKNKRVYREVFDFVIVCSGVYKKGKYPLVPGLDTFKGDTGHSQTFRNGLRYKGKRVLVVGNANSSGDLVTATANHADQVYLSVGRGTYLMPRCGPKGVPWEYIVMRRPNFYSTSKTNSFLFDYYNSFFDHRKSGLSPSTPPLMSARLISDEIQMLILTGKVKVMGQLTRIGPNKAEFTDGTVVENLDVILFATGYDMCFDFLEEELIDENNKMTLYKMIFPVQLPHNTLAVVGVPMSAGAVPPILELQARYIARIFAKHHYLPSRKTMIDDVERFNMMTLETHGRYKYEISYFQYKDELAKELGVLPSWWNLIKAGPRLAYLYLFGPVFPYFCRLWGPHCWSGAREAIENAMEHGYYTKQPRKAPEIDV